MTEETMDLTRKALRGLVQFLLVLGVMIFLPAGSLDFPEGWAYWLVFAASTALITLYFLKHDRRLIARRLHAGPTAEKETSQKIIQTLALIVIILLIMTPGLDRRFGWSNVPTYLVIIGNGLVAIGFLIMFIVFKENSHAASIITVERDQKVVSSGLYRWIRHPMYAGAIVTFSFTPPALGSYWGLVWIVPLVGVMAWRLLDEEKFLARNLEGYTEYCRITRPAQ